MDATPTPADLSDFHLKPSQTQNYENGGKKGSFTSFPLENSKDKPLFVEAFNIEFFAKECDGFWLNVYPDDESEHKAFKGDMDALYELMATEARLPKDLSFRENYTPVLMPVEDGKNKTGKTAFSMFAKYSKSPKLEGPDGKTVTMSELAGKRGRAVVKLCFNGLYYQSTGKDNKNVSTSIRKLLIGATVLDYTDYPQGDASKYVDQYKKRKLEIEKQAEEDAGEGAGDEGDK